MTTSASSTRAIFAMSCAALIYSLFNLIIRKLEIYFTPNQQSSLRITLAGAIALVIVVITKKNFKELLNFNKAQLALFTFITPLFLFFFTNAITKTNVLTGIVAYYAISLIATTIFGWAIYKERINVYQFLSILIATTGIVIFGWPLTDAFNDVGFIFGMFAGLADAVNNVARRMAKDKVDRFVLMVPALFIGGACVLIYELISGSKWKVLDFDLTAQLQAFAWIFLYASLIVTVSWLVLYGFAHLSMTNAALLLVIEIPLSALFAWWVYSEKPSSNNIVGSIAVIFAVVLSTYRKKKDRQNNTVAYTIGEID